MNEVISAERTNKGERVNCCERTIEYERGHQCRENQIRRTSQKCQTEPTRANELIDLRNNHAIRTSQVDRTANTEIEPMIPREPIRVNEARPSERTKTDELIYYSKNRSHTMIRQYLTTAATAIALGFLFFALWVASP